MKIKVDLPAEYWYALSFCASEDGYFSRQDFVEELLKTYVNTRPEMLAKGKEKMMLDERTKLLAVKERAKIEPVVMKRHIQVNRFTRIKLYYKDEDKQPVVVHAQTYLDAFKKVMGRPAVGAEFYEVFSKWEYVS